MTIRAGRAHLGMIVALLVAACSRAPARSVDAAAPTPCDTAVIGAFLPTEVSLASEAPVQRTIARLGMAYIAALEYCRTHRHTLPPTADVLLIHGRKQPLRTPCALRDTAQFLDEWGTKFDWVIAGGHLLVVSHGPDGVRGTSDDIRSPPPPGVASDTFDVAEFCD